MVVLLRKILLSAFFILSIAPSHAQAASFFTAYVPVESQDKSAFKAASSDALLQLLMKSTGKTPKELLSHIAIEKGVKNASRSVQQFSYQTDTHTSNSDKNKIYLQATFSKQLISSLLQHANLKMLLDHRPSLAVIVITQKDGRLSILKSGSEIADADYPSLQRSSGANGVLSKPISDKLLRSYSAKNLWYFNENYIETIGKSLAVDNVLIVRLAYMSDGRWVGGSYYKQLGPISRQVFKTKELNGSSFTRAINPLFEQLNSHWLTQYAVRLNASQNEIVMQVSNLTGFDHFKVMMAEIEGLSVVEHVYVLQTNDSEITLSIALKSDFKTFLKHISTVTQLKAIAFAAESQEQPGQILRYQWIN